MARLMEKFTKEVKPVLVEKFGYKNTHQVPSLVKIVINMGVGEASQDRSVLDEAVRDLALITGQKPVVTRTRKAVASFKIRENIPIGCKVTLRGKMMYEFLDRLISVALPNVKDFRGVSRRFDGRGNYSMGWKDHTLYPEVNLDDVSHTFGMDISFVTTARTDDESLALLEALGIPFRKN